VKRSRLFPVLCKGVLAVFLCTCLLGLVIHTACGHSDATSPSRSSLEPVSTVEQQAWQVAAEVVGSGKKAQEQFVNELLDLYNKIKDGDLVIFCNSGGWGNKPLYSDYQGESLLTGIETKLAQLGYKPYVVDDIRTGNGLTERINEFKEQLTHYPSKAKLLAAKIDFLTQNIANLKVIITGQSNGAALAGEVANRLKDNSRVYSIQVGIPFWHRVYEVSNSLVIDNSGVGSDALTHRDLLTIIKGNWAKLFILNHAPAFTPVDWLISRVVLILASYDFGLGLQAPGHEYMWEYPGVGPVIEAFLVKNFDIH
jgi:pimeloyl-ACP methyl ester carboxylesterase